MKKFKYLLLTTMMAMSMAGCGASGDGEDTSEGAGTTESGVAKEVIQSGQPVESEEIAIITTSLGEIKVRFYPEEAPLAVENFKELAKADYYDGIIFHRVIEDFMIQGGDPTGTGTGGASYYGAPFEDEISPNLHFYRGALAMANSGANTNGSQFFIVQNPVANASAIDAIRDKVDESINVEPFAIPINGTSYPIEEVFTEEVLTHYEENGGHVELEYVFGGVYTIFGQVFEGMDIVDAIAAVMTGENDKPVEDIVIYDVEIVGDATQESEDDGIATLDEVAEEEAVGEIEETEAE